MLTALAFLASTAFAADPQVGRWRLDVKSTDRDEQELRLSLIAPRKTDGPPEDVPDDGDPNTKVRNALRALLSCGDLLEVSKSDAGWRVVGSGCDTGWVQARKRSKYEHSGLGKVFVRIEEQADRLVVQRVCPGVTFSEVLDPPAEDGSMAMVVQIDVQDALQPILIRRVYRPELAEAEPAEPSQRPQDDAPVPSTDPDDASGG